MSQRTRAWMESELDELVALYVDQGWGLNRLEKHFRSNASTLQRALLSRGAELRSVKRQHFTDDLSVDRRDSAKGYTADNIVLCCRFANYAKNAFSEATFKQLLEATAQNLTGHNFAEEKAKTEDCLTA